MGKAGISLVPRLLRRITHRYSKPRSFKKGYKPCHISLLCGRHEYGNSGTICQAQCCAFRLLNRTQFIRGVSLEELRLSLTVFANVQNNNERVSIRDFFRSDIKCPALSIYVGGIARIGFQGNTISRMQLPGWNSIEKTALFSSVFWWLGIAALVSLALFEVLDHIYSSRKEELIAKASETELRVVKQRVGWRQLSNRFAEDLKGRPSGVAEIVYREGDDEAYGFADGIRSALSSAGWKVTSPITNASKIESASRPFMLREAGMSVSDYSTVAVLSWGPMPAKPYDGGTPLDSVMHAFGAADLPVFQVVPYESLRPPEGTVRIVVGPRI